MKKHLLILFILLPMLAFAGDVTTYNFNVKNMGMVGSGYIDLSFKIDIRNNETPGMFFVEVQGVDSEGFEVMNTNASGYFKPYESKTITWSRMCLITNFNKIKEWKSRTTKN